MARAKSNGIELEYEVFGDDDAEPMLLVMGLGAQMLLWREDFCLALAERGFRVIRFDNRDIGASTWLDDAPAPDARTAFVRFALGLKVDAPYTLSDMAADAAGLLDALDIERAHVVGASMGGMIAQALAIERGERVSSLTSIMSTPGGRLNAMMTPKALGALLQTAPKTREEAADANAFFLEACGGTLPKDAEEGREIAMRCFDRGRNPPGFLRQMAAVCASYDRRKKLRAIEMPTLVIHGTADPLVLPRAGKATARAVSHAKLDMIDGMGHHLPRLVWPRVVDAIAGNAAAAG